MLENLVSIFSQNPLSWTLFLLFYALVGFFLYKNRKKIKRESILFLYRTKKGIKLINKISKYRFWKYWGYVGIVAGFSGMLFITGYLLLIAVRFLTAPAVSESTLKFVLPGPFAANTSLVMFIPIEYFIPVLLLVIVIHEGCHGIIARVHQLKILSTGLGLFLFFPLAFVEPDEKALEKAKLSKQLSVFAAGPFANICATILALILVVLMFNPSILGASAFFVESDNPMILSVEEGGPADLAGISEFEKILSVNNIKVDSVSSFQEILQDLSPGEEISFETDSGNYAVVLGEAPANPEKAYVGVDLSQELHSFLKNKIGKHFVNYTFVLFQWIIILNFGIGLFNLLPMGPTDGGRMIFAVLKKITKNKAKIIFKTISYAVLALLLITIFGPILVSFFGGLGI